MSRTIDAPEWPDRIVLRDTKVIADEGQRIFSTATGYGYEKREYVRADLVPATSSPVSPAGEADAHALIGAWEQITAERDRQTSSEGWSADHDNQHDNAEMLSAAVIYLWHGTEKAAPMPSHVYHPDSDPDMSAVPLGWPWAAKWWKPRDRLRNLVRAGALCLAEHDRCVRAGLRTAPADHKLGIVLRELAMLSAAPKPAVEAEAVAIAWIKLNHPEIPLEAAHERDQLQKRIALFGPGVVADILQTYALMQPKQGSFAGSLWALAEWAHTRLASPPATETTRKAALEEAIAAATAFNEEFGDGADTLHHGRDMIAQIRALIETTEGSAHG